MAYAVTAPYRLGDLQMQSFGKQSKVPTPHSIHYGTTAALILAAMHTSGLPKSSE